MYVEVKRNDDFLYRYGCCCRSFSLLGKPDKKGCIPEEHANSSSVFDIIFTDIVGVGLIKNVTGPLYSKYK